MAVLHIGEKIKQARKEKGLTQKELAEKLGIKRETIYKYENGIVKNIPQKNIVVMESALSVSLCDFEHITFAKEDYDNDIWTIIEKLSKLTKRGIKNGNN